MAHEGCLYQPTQGEGSGRCHFKKTGNFLFIFYFQQWDCSIIKRDLSFSHGLERRECGTELYLTQWWIWRWETNEIPSWSVTETKVIDLEQGEGEKEGKERIVIPLTGSKSC